MKLLIIDDEPAILETVEMRMRRDGFTTFTADSAEEGMRLFRRIKPDLVILDIMLPHENGFQLIGHIRNKKSWHEVPIVMLTARSQEHDITRALEAGANDYVIKPFRPNELMARIRRLIT